MEINVGELITGELRQRSGKSWLNRTNQPIYPTTDIYNIDNLTFVIVTVILTYYLA